MNRCLILHYRPILNVYKFDGGRSVVGKQSFIRVRVVCLIAFFTQLYQVWLKHTYLKGLKGHPTIALTDDEESVWWHLWPIIHPSEKYGCTLCHMNDFLNRDLLNFEASATLLSAWHINIMSFRQECIRIQQY